MNKLLPEVTARYGQGSLHVRTSDRMLIAQIARDAALQTDGVVALNSYPGRVDETVEQNQRVAGVVVAAESRNRYELVVHIVAELVPLPELASRLSRQIRAALEVEGLSDRVGAIDIAIDDLSESIPRRQEA